METPNQNSGTVAQHRQRFTLVAMVLLGAQVMYLLFAFTVRASGFRASNQGDGRHSLTIVLFVAGLAATAISFPAARLAARRLPAPTDLPKTAMGLAQIFFVGFCFSQGASLAGLAIFFLTANIMVLLILVCVASIGIGIHYRRVLQMYDKLPAQL